MRWILAQDLGRVGKIAWEKNRTIPELAKSLTAQQFFDLFWTSASEPPPDRLELLRKWNEEAGKRGQSPSVPWWVFKGVPRGAG